MAQKKKKQERHPHELFHFLSTDQPIKVSSQISVTHIKEVETEVEFGQKWAWKFNMDKILAPK